MRYAIRGGHSKASPGAAKLLDELYVDRIVYPKVINLLQKANNTVHNITPSEGTPYPGELSYGINVFNNLSVDLGASVHLNCGGGNGSEIWLYANADSKTVNTANRILKNLSNLGFKNRGIKHCPGDGRGLGEILSTNKPFMIIEICFVDSSVDKMILNKVGYDAVALAIAQGLDPNVKSGNMRVIKEEVKLMPKYDDKTRPEGDAITPLGKHSYLEESADGRTILHRDRGNYIAIGQGFIDLYWNDNKGHGGYKRISE